MPLYVMKKFNGITAEEARELEILEDDFVTKEALESFGLLRKAVLEEMTEAVNEGDMERVEYLDDLYQQLLNFEENLATAIHQNYMLE